MFPVHLRVHHRPTKRSVLAEFHWSDGDRRKKHVRRMPPTDCLNRKLNAPGSLTCHDDADGLIDTVIYVRSTVFRFFLYILNPGRRTGDHFNGKCHRRRANVRFVIVIGLLRVVPGERERIARAKASVVRTQPSPGRGLRVERSSLSG